MDYWTPNSPDLIPMKSFFLKISEKRKFDVEIELTVQNTGSNRQQLLFVFLLNLTSCRTPSYCLFFANTTVNKNHR